MLSGPSPSACRGAEILLWKLCRNRDFSNLVLHVKPKGMHPFFPLPDSPRSSFPFAFAPLGPLPLPHHPPPSRVLWESRRQLLCWAPRGPGHQSSLLPGQKWRRGSRAGPRSPGCCGVGATKQTLGSQKAQPSNLMVPKGLASLLPTFLPWLQI